MAEDKITNLYNAFVNSGYSMEPENEFRENLKDPKKRKAAYDALVGNGYQMEPYEEFETNIGFGQPAQPAQPTTQTEATHDPATTEQSQQTSSSPAPVSQQADDDGYQTYSWSRALDLRMRQGDEDFYLPIRDIEEFGGWSKWAEAHKDSPIQVYLHNGYTPAQAFPISEVADRKSQGWTHSGRKRTKKTTNEEGAEIEVEDTDEPQPQQAIPNYKRETAANTDKSVLLRVNGKDVKVPYNEIYVYGGLEQWADAHNDGSQDIKVYVKSKDGYTCVPVKGAKSDTFMYVKGGEPTERGLVESYNLGLDEVEQLWKEAEEKYKADANKIPDRNWSQYAAMGGGREMRVVTASVDRHEKAAAHLTHFDLETMMNNMWQRRGAEMTQKCLADLKKQYPDADEQELKQYAEQKARWLNDNIVYKYAVQKNTPQSELEYFMRQVMDMNLLVNISRGLDRSRAGKSGDMAAYEQAMGDYAKDHRFTQVAGTVVGMAVDPTTWVSGGVGSAAGKSATALGAKMMFKEATAEVAKRQFANTLTGRIIAGTAGSMANLATYEGIKEAERQWVHGGYINPETGENEGYSATEILKSSGHGSVMGTAMGPLSPIIGNTADKVVKVTNSAGGKVAVRGGEISISTLAEGTVFSIPEWIEGERDAYDVWTDNMAMMLGFKAQHGIKSAPRVIESLRPVKPTEGRPLTQAERNHNRMNFSERVRKAMDASPSDLAFTKEETEELRNAGYGELADLFVKDDVKEKRRTTTERTDEANADEAGIQLYGESVEAETVHETPEFDGYSDMERLMQDPNVSQAARAKAYYILTGRMLPMSTITGYREVNNEGGTTTIQSVSADGEVITSRTFKDGKKAQNEINAIQRQAELNTIDVGERYQEAIANEKVVDESLKEAIDAFGATQDFQGAGFNEFKKLYYDAKTSDMELSDAQRQFVEMVDEAIERNQGIADSHRPQAIREDIKSEFDVDVDEAIKKSPGDRTALEQEAVMEYAKRLYPEEARRGFEEPNEPTPEEAQAQETYDAGREVYDTFEQGDPEAQAEAQAEADAIAIRMREAYQLCEEAFGDDAEYWMYHVNENPWSLLNDPVITDAQREAILYYVNAKAALNGVMDASNEAADRKRQEVQQDIEKRTHKDLGSIQPATMKADDKQVYVVKGDVVMFPDGTGVDVSNSSQSVVVYDPETGEYKFTAPEMILRVDESINPQDELNNAFSTIEQEQSSIFTENVDDLTEQGERPEENPTETPTEEINEEPTETELPEENAEVTDEAVEQPTDENAGEANPPIANVEDYDKGYEDSIEFGSTLSDEQLTSAIEQLRNGEATDYNRGFLEALEYEQQRRTMEGGNNPSDEVLPEENAEVTDEPQAETALSRIPIDEETQEPMFEKVDKETAWDGLVEAVGGEKDAADIAQAQIAQAQSELEALKKKPPTMKAPKLKGSPMAMAKAKREANEKFQQDMDAYNQSLADTQARLDAWNAILGVHSARSAEARRIAEEERAARDAELHDEVVARFEEQQRIKAEKDAEQAAIGTHAVNPKIKEKWDSAQKTEGHSDIITLPDGSQLRGKYILYEAGAASASHDPNTGFTPTEGFPIDENGQSVNDRDYQRDKDAQRIVEDMAGAYDNRALQNPVVVSQDGIVLSGNNRTMSGDLAARQGTDTAYIDYLKEFGAKYGFTPEQIEGMQHPRVAFVPDETLPYDATTFSRFNAQEMKSQSKPEAAVKLGKIVPDNVFNQIVNDISGYDRLSDFYADEKAVAHALGSLLQAGVINDKQMPELRTGNSLSAAGKELIENTLIGKVFQSNPEAVRQLIGMPTVRQSVVMGLSEISANRTLAGAGYDLSEELAKAVDLVTRTKTALPDVFTEGVPVSPFGRQQGLFDDEFGDSRVTDATTLLLADILNSGKPSDLRKVLATYNKDASQAAAGQLDIFSGEPHSKEEILTNVNNLFKNATSKEQQELINAAIADRKNRAGQESEQAPTVSESGTESAERAGGNAGGDGERSDNLQQEKEIKITAPLSETETDEFGKPLVKASDGSTTFGMIDAESGLTEAPIRLSVGENYLDEGGKNRGYGLVHIEAGHGQDIRNAGYNSVEEFVEDVARNWTEIKEGAKVGDTQTYLLEVPDEHNNTLFIQLSRDGQYWNVNSGGIFKKRYSRNKKKVHSVPAVGGGKDTDTTEVDSGQTKGATAPAGDSSQTSADKGSENPTDTQIKEPTEAQKLAGNYKKKHIRVDGYDISVENEKGSIRRGKDADGNEWETEMQNDYGYIRGTKGKDGDHIDVYLSDTPEDGDVFVIDQVNADGTFDEHKVMYGFTDIDSAHDAYLSNYEAGWTGLGTITHVSKDEFKKWVKSSKRKTKPFAEYANVNAIESQQDNTPAQSDLYTITPTTYTNKKGKTSDIHLVKFNRELSKEEQAALKEFIAQPLSEGKKTPKGWYDRKEDGYMMRSEEAAKELASMIGNEEAIADAQPLTAEDYRQAVAQTSKPTSTENKESLIGKEYTIKGRGGIYRVSKIDEKKKRITLVSTLTGADGIELEQKAFDMMLGRDEIKPYVHTPAKPRKSPTNRVSVEGLFSDLNNRGETNFADNSEPIEPAKEEPAKAEAEHEVTDDEMRSLLGDIRDILGIGEDEGGIKFRDPDGLTKEQRMKLQTAGMRLAMGLVERGAVKFEDYAKQMVGLLGDKIRPWMKAFYGGLRYVPGFDEYEFTPYEEVERFDVENFDKAAPNAIADAEMRVVERKAANVSEKANQEIKEIRNQNRKKDEQQTEADTAALTKEAGIVASQARSVAETSRDRKELNRASERIDETLEKINDQLALLGFYEADPDSPEHEIYGQRRSAEKKAVKDATNLARQLVNDLGIDWEKAGLGKPNKRGERKPKPLATSNLTGIDGDITINLPMPDGRNLHINIGLEPTYERTPLEGIETSRGGAWEGDNLKVGSIYYRLDGRLENGRGDDSNHFLNPDVTYADMLKDIQRVAGYGKPKETANVEPSKGQDSWHDEFIDYIIGNEMRLNTIQKAEPNRQLDYILDFAREFLLERQPHYTADNYKDSVLVFNDFVNLAPKDARELANKLLRYIDIELFKKEIYAPKEEVAPADDNIHRMADALGVDEPMLRGIIERIERGEIAANRPNQGGYFDELWKTVDKDKAIKLANSFEGKELPTPVAILKANGILRDFIEARGDFDVRDHTAKKVESPAKKEEPKDIFEKAERIANQEKELKAAVTPLERQWEEMKKKHPDALLLFRVGDFYELLHDDAKTAAELLGITLTQRATGNGNRIPLAGFPHQALDTYLPKLVRSGQRVAICEQLEEPKQTKKMVKRGTTTETPTPQTTEPTIMTDAETEKVLDVLNPNRKKKKETKPAVKPEQTIGSLFDFSEENDNFVAPTTKDNESRPSNSGSQGLAKGKRDDSVGRDEARTNGGIPTAGTDGTRTVGQPAEKGSAGRKGTDGTTHGTDEERGIQPRIGNRGRDESAVDSGSESAGVERGGTVGAGTQPKRETDGGTKGISEGEPTAGVSGRSGVASVRKKAPEIRYTNNFRYGEDGNEADNYTPSQRLEANVSAIETLADLLFSGKPATAEQKAIMSRFRGWGQVYLGKFYDVDQMANYNVNPNRTLRRLAEVIKKLDPQGEKKLFEAVKRASLTAYYTPTPIATAMNSFLSLAGYRGGNFLDPSMGNGIFEGTLPKDIQERSAITGVELDWLTGQLSRALYPDANIIIGGFEKAGTPIGMYDVVTSNVPFGQFGVNDPTWSADSSPLKRSAQNRIHNYFAVKMLEAARPGGIVSMMTTSAVMDTPSNQNIRAHIADQGEILGAIRLPDNTFQGTGAVADIIFIRKWRDDQDRMETRSNPEYQELEASFLDSHETLAPNKLNGTKQKVRYNAYFNRNRRNMIGDVQAGNQYSQEGFGLTSQLTVDEIAGEVEKAIKRIVGKRKGQIFNPSRSTREVQQAVREAYKGDGDWVSNGNLVIQDGKVGVLNAKSNEYGEVTREFEGTLKHDKMKPRIEAMIDVRTAMKKLIAGQIEGEKESTLAKLREELQKAYDTFVGKYGRLQDNPFILDDIDGYTLQALETWKGGKFVGLSDIFTKNTIKPALKLDGAKTPQEAITTSLAEYGYLRPDYLEKAIGKDWEDKCADFIFKKPNSEDDYVTRDEYLSGDVVTKLAEAREAAKLDERFERNVQALEEVQPERIPFDDIAIHLGARWIPETILNDFIKDIFGLHASSSRSRHYDRELGRMVDDLRSGVRYLPDVDSFEINIEKKELGGQAQDWETPKKSAKEILQAALEDKNVVIKYKDSEGNEHIDEEQTELANQKIADLRDKFEEWLPSDPERVEMLEQAYNDRFNRTVIRTFDGSHLNVPGLMGKELRPHQKDAVWMLINNRGGIVDHIVGAGKTLVMQAAIMEMRRMGIAKKPMIVALKSTVSQIAREFKEAFPSARVLAPSDSDFQKENRKKFIANISLNDYDCVILSHEQYCMLPHTEEAERAVIDEQMWQLDNMIEYLYGTNDQSQMTKKQIKALEKRRENLKARLEKRLDRNVDREFCFENLGVDYLFVDESHQFKSLPYVTSYQKVAGLGDSQGSNRAVALLTGIRHLQRMHQGDKGTVFLSGTTITNSLVEIYNLLNYLRPRELERLGMPTFDAWASTFAVHSSELEAGTTGTFQMKDRFRSFDNVPELSQLYAEIADVRNDTNLKLPKPAIEAHTVIVPASPQMQEINQEIINMLQNKDGSYFGIHPKDPNRAPWGLHASTLSAKAAVSPRLVFPDWEDEGGKIHAVTENVKKYYDAHTDQKGVQLIFCELGVPGNGKEYDAYTDIKNRLVNDYGIPKDEIAFIQDAPTDEKRKELFQKVRDGKVRVLIGGTKNMGTGVNVQDRITDMHMLTVPWTPSALDQCIGRGARQGNWLAEMLNNRVRVHYYATEGSLDLYKYQLLEAKGKMFTQFKMGTVNGGRSFDEGSGDEEGGMDPAEMVARLSGNPVIFERAKQEKAVKKLRALRNGFERDYQRKKAKFNELTERKGKYERLIRLNESDRKELERGGFVADEKGVYPTAVTVMEGSSFYGGRTFDKPKEAGEYIHKLLKEGKSVKLSGFGKRARIEQVNDEKEGLFQTHYEVVIGEGNYDIRYSVRLSDDATAAGVAFRNLLKRIIDNGEVYKRELDNITTTLQGMNIGDGVFPKKQELEEAEAKLKELNIEFNKLGKKEEKGKKFRTSSEIDAQYPNWLDGTTTDSGKHSTQVEGTRKTYGKVGDWIEANLGKGVAILDASSGMGYGTRDLRERGFDIEDVEPYQSEQRKAENPATYDSYDAIEKQYDYIISNAVLNVIPDDWRRNVLHDMAARLNPGGKLFINTRKAGEEKSIKDKIELDTPQEVLVKRNGRIASYQRFFTPAELKQWVESELGDGYTVEIANEKNSGTKGLAAVVVTRDNAVIRSTSTDPKDMETRVRELSQKLHTPIRIVTKAELDADAKKVQAALAEGKTDVKPEFTPREVKSLGWFDPKTGEVVVVMPNNKSVADIENSVVHEVVGHDGLQALVGAERMDEFMNEIYDHASDEIKQKIDAIADRMIKNEADNIYQQAIKDKPIAQAGFFRDAYQKTAERQAEAKREQYRRAATEEYMADMAGKIGDEGFEKMSRDEQTLWGRIKARVQKFLDAFLRKLKIPARIRLTDKDLAYILFKSWKNKRSGGGVFAEAEDVNMRRKTGYDADDVTRFRDPDMGLEETITRLKAEAMQANTDNLQAKRDAMRAIGGNLNHLRSAMARQKEYDITTVKSITDLAKVFLENNLLDDLSKYETKRILGTINNVIGKQNVSKYVQNIMDIMVDNQLRQGANTLGRLLSIRGSRVDARGIEVQGELDPDGQAIARVVRKSTSLPKDDIDTRISEAINRMGSADQAIADEATLEYAGLQIARQYVEDITESKAEEKALRDSLKQAKEDYDAGNMSEAAYRQYVSATEDAIRQNKIERAEAFHSLVEQVGGMMSESIERAKEWREAEKQRVEEIQHNANSDMEGRPTDEHHKNDRVQKLSNNSFARFMLAPLATFDQMLRMFGKKNARGEGYLWNRYMRGWVDATEREYLGYRNDLKVLDNKVSEVFGKKMRWGDLFTIDRKLPKATVNFWDGGDYKDHELTQGNLLYIYMADKMADGRMKLRRMGITEEDVADIANFLDPRFIELADWMQEEFLVDKRNEYNEVHKRMFGASMAAIENYFPLKILANARLENIDVADDTTDTALPATSTGSIIKRRRNNLALDVTGANAFSVILDHLQQMERWAAFAEFNRDLNTLLSYKRFRNQVMNMSSIYGGGKTLWNNFRNECSMAAGAYCPPIAALDKSAVNIAKGVTAAKVSFRVFTALKQFLSMPAYVSDSNPLYLAKNIANPIGAWKWSMENLPIFEKRWKSRMAGDPRLLKSEMDWKMWRSRIVEIASRVGMSPNAFVDALTVAIGTHAMYETKKAKYLRWGMSEEDADRRAKQDATILFNQTQQSSEGAFLSTMQVDRSWLSVLFTVFRNSSMSYTRQLYDAMRNLGRYMKPGYADLSEEFMAKQMRRDGIDPDTADKEAKREYRRGILRNLVRLGIFGFALQLAWNLGAYLPYLILGDDEDEKDKMWDDVMSHTMFGAIEGVTGGDVLSSAGNMWAKDDWQWKNLSKDMPLSSDIQNILQNWNNDNVSAMNDVINLLVQSGVGVNPQSLTDAVIAVMDYCGDDAQTSRECALLIARIINCPQSQIDKIYFDEIDASAREASKMTPEEIAERYARYKVRRGAPLTGWAYGSETREKVMNKYRDKSDKIAKERIGAATDKATGTDMSQALSDYESVKSQLSQIKRVKNTDEDRYYDLLDEIEATPEFERYEIVKDYKKDVDELTKEWLRAKTIEERDSCAKAIIELKREMINELNSVQQ